MCEPTTIAVGASVAMAALAAKVQDDKRKQQNKLKGEAVDLTNRVFNNKVAGVDDEFEGKLVASGEAKQQRVIEGWQARATSQVAAGDLQGLSVDAVLADFDRQIGVGNSSIDNSVKLQANATNTAVDALALGTEGQLFNLRKEKFNPGAVALGIGQAAFSGFAAGGGFKPSGGRPKIPVDKGVSSNVAKSFSNSVRLPSPKSISNSPVRGFARG